jgi:hypothetical protein
LDRCREPDITISSIVADRPTAVRVALDISQGTDPNQNVTVQLSIDGPTAQKN